MNTSYTSLDELVKHCSDGSKHAMMEVYDRFHGMVFSTISKYISNKAEAEDIMQETFIKAFDKIGQLDHPENLGGWLKRMAIYAAIDTLRKERSFESLNDQIAEEKEPVNAWEGLSVADINAAIEKLAEGYKTVLRLFLIEGYSHEEIGALIGISASTSRSQYSRAKRLLKEQLLAHVG